MKTIGCVFTTAVIFATATAQAQTMTFAHGYPARHPMTNEGFEPFVACVEEATGGELTIEHFPGGQIATMRNAIDALNSGLADISAVLVGQESAKLPVNGITLLPGLGDTAVEMVEAWRREIDAGGAMADEMAANGLHPILVNFLPPYQIFSTKGEVEGIEGFGGLKTRVSGGAMNMTASQLGAIPVEIDVDMYVGLQRGVIDATFLALTSAKTYSVQELATAVSSNGSFGSGTVILAMSDTAWEGLSDENREIVNQCGLDIEASIAAYLDNLNEELKAEFSDLGIDVFSFSEEARAAMQDKFSAVAEAYISRIEEQGHPARAAYDGYMTAIAR